jgi:hypothetical protein
MGNGISQFRLATATAWLFKHTLQESAQGSVKLIKALDFGIIIDVQCIDPWVDFD